MIFGVKKSQVPAAGFKGGSTWICLVGEFCTDSGYHGINQPFFTTILVKFTSKSRYF